MSKNMLVHLDKQRVVVFGRTRLLHRRNADRFRRENGVCQRLRSGNADLLLIVRSLEDRKQSRILRRLLRYQIRFFAQARRSGKTVVRNVSLIGGRVRIEEWVEENIISQRLHSLRLRHPRSPRSGRLVGKSRFPHRRHIQRSFITQQLLPRCDEEKTNTLEACARRNGSLGTWATGVSPTPRKEHTIERVSERSTPNDSSPHILRSIENDGSTEMHHLLLLIHVAVRHQVSDVAV